jgi:LPS export ABC transporter protein LptC
MSRIRLSQYCLIGLTLAVLGGALAAYRGFSKEPETVAPTSPEDQDEGIRLSEIHHVATRHGVKEWILDAQSAQYQRQENKTVLKHISATFFLRDGRSIHLASRDGMLLTDTKDMEVSGDVVARSGPYELNTERLFYDHQNRSISTDSPVVVKGKGMDLSGKSMVFSLRTERALIRGGVEAVFENLRLL